MANVYGPEFDLSTGEIINTIKKVYKLKAIDFTFDPIEVEMALFNNDYYVRPAAKQRFMIECEKAFGEVKLHYGKIDDKILHFNYIIQLLGIIKKFFDETYFEEQIIRRKQSMRHAANKDKLGMYLKKFNIEQLKTFLNTVVICKNLHGLFISSVSSVSFWEKIHNACRKKGLNVPLDFGSIEGREFLENNESYYFNVLSTKTISNMLCEAIDLDIEVATSAAKKLYTSGYDAMINCIRRRIGV
jgi:hypothetical protein